MCVLHQNIKECNKYTWWLMNMLCKDCIILKHMADYNIIQKTFFMNFSQTSSRPLLDLSWISHRLLPDLSHTCSILHPFWLAPHDTIANAKFLPMTQQLSRSDYHKSAKCSPPSCPKILRSLHCNQQADSNEPAITRSAYRKKTRLRPCQRLSHRHFKVPKHFEKVNFKKPTLI